MTYRIFLNIPGEADLRGNEGEECGTVAAPGQQFWTGHGLSGNLPVCSAHESARESDARTE